MGALVFDALRLYAPEMRYLLSVLLGLAAMAAWASAPVLCGLSLTGPLTAQAAWDRIAAELDASVRRADPIVYERPGLAEFDEVYASITDETPFPERRARFEQLTLLVEKLSAIPSPAVQGELAARHAEARLRVAANLGYPPHSTPIAPTADLAPHPLGLDKPGAFLKQSAQTVFYNAATRRFDDAVARVLPRLSETEKGVLLEWLATTSETGSLEFSTAFRATLMEDNQWTTFLGFLQARSVVTLAQIGTKPALRNLAKAQRVRLFWPRELRNPDGSEAVTAEFWIRTWLAADKTGERQRLWDARDRP